MPQVAGFTVYNSKAHELGHLRLGAEDSGKLYDLDYMLGIVLCNQISSNNDVYYCNRHYDQLYNEQATENSTTPAGSRSCTRPSSCYYDAASLHHHVVPGQAAGLPDRHLDRLDPGDRRDDPEFHQGQLPKGAARLGSAQRDVSGFRYLGRKIVWLVVTLYFVVTFNFVLFHLLPGNPVRLLARSEYLTPQAVAEITRVYRLNHPPLEQYLIYLQGLLHGQLGISYTYREPVSTLLGQYLGNTVVLLAAATVLTMVLGVLVGVIAANRRGGGYDSTTVTASVIGWSLPTFWTGLILAFVLGVWLHAFPIFGMETPNAIYTSPFQRIEDIGSDLFLPTLTLIIVNIAQFVLVTRASVIEVLSEDFMLTATAKGLLPRRILWRHAVRNALLPVVTASALLISLVVAGAIEVETVFSWPGMGLLVYNSVLNRDYPVIEAAFLVFAVVVLLVNFACDLLYQALDPRVRES